MPEQLKPNPAAKFEVRNERFDEYCALYFKNLSEEQKKLLPYELVRKLHLPHRLSFAQKIYIASVAFETEVFIVMRPFGKMGIPNEEDIEWLSECDETIASCEQLLDTIGFVLSTKDVASVYAKAHRMAVSPAVRYILKSQAKGRKIKGDLERFDENTAFVGNLVLNFCCMVKKMVLDHDISVAEFYALVYLQDGKEKHVYPLQQRAQYAFGGSKRSLSTAFPKLAHKGLAERINHRYRRFVKYKISTKGLAKFNELISKYITNF